MEVQHAVVPGKPDASELYETMVNSEDPMPPRNYKPRPSAADIALLRTWIAKGAPAWKEEAPAAKDVPPPAPPPTPAK